MAPKPRTDLALVTVREYEVQVVREKPGRAGIVTVRGPDDMVAVLRQRFKAPKEKFLRLDLNARHELIGIETVSVGSLNASIVHPREVFKGAVLAGAASIVIAHNHPSGDPEPSEEDLSITKRLVEVGELVGIGVLDHIVWASRGWVSFRSRGLL